MEKDFHEAQDADILDFDPGDLGTAADDGQSQLLEEGKIDMDLEGLSLEGGKPVGNRQQLGAHGRQVFDSLLEEEVF